MVLKSMVNILIAYPYFSNTVEQAYERFGHGFEELMIDSGAFTAYNAGKKIELWDYIDFLKRIDYLKPKYRIQLDVIGDHKATKENYKKTLDLGMDVIPVFTRGTPINEINDLLATSNIALLGGVAQGKDREKYTKFVLDNAPKGRLHLLGFTNQWIVDNYQPYSVDASSWKKSARFGGFDLFVPNKGIYSIDQKRMVRDRVKLHNFVTKKNPLLGEWLEGYIKDKKQKGAIYWNKSYHQMLSTYAWVEYAYYIYKKNNTRFFFSCSSDWDLEFVFNANLIFKGFKEVKE